ncbi:hypothetical protein LJC15_05265 [Desulfovibrio sp. OttesenSCG-928-G11]|nr:hypothetical protein [Desulfovibrio sp. OttesenSCG-928-G11]
MADLLDDASLPTDPVGLKAEIAEAERRMASCRDEIKNLMAAERPAEGLFHAEAIHGLKQQLMMLRYQKDLRAARLGRLLTTDG